MTARVERVVAEVGAIAPGHETYATYFRNSQKLQLEAGLAGDPKGVADTI